MTEVEKIMSETKEIAENIKANYTLEKTALQFGCKILIEKENRNCITLCDDFYYFDESVKEAEEKLIDTSNVSKYTPESCTNTAKA